MDKEKTKTMTSTMELTETKYVEKEQKSNKLFKEMTTKEKLAYIREVITVEPILACYLMATILCTPALLNLEFEKACRVNEGFDDTVCESILKSEISNYSSENEAIQQRIADMHSWQQPVQNVVPIILVLFLGSYSDRHKIRKPFLLMPIIGEFLAVIACILCVVFMRTWPLEVQGIAQTVVPSFFGGPNLIVMMAFAYIADISTVEMRTLRVGVLQFVLTLCSPIIQSFSGKLFATIGYLGILCAGGVIFAIGLLYGIFCIKEPKQPEKTEDIKALIKDIFGPTLVLDTFKLLIYRKKGNNRLLIVLVMITLFIFVGVTQGESSVFYLFAVTVYQWGPVEYTLFGTVNTIIHLIGVAVAIPLLSTYLKINDNILGILGFLDKIAANIVFALYLTPVGLYIGSVVSIIIGVGSIAIRSEATKVVHPDDLGKAQSLFAIVEALAPAIIIPLYSSGVYAKTIQSFPGAYFFVGVGLYVVGIVIFMYMYSATKEKPTTQNGDAKQEYAYENKASDIAETTHI